MELTEEKVLSGARKILTKCLSLDRGDDVVIFCDETTVKVSSFLARAAHDNGIDYAILFEPVHLQPYHNPGEEFLWPIKTILDRTCAILTCLNDRLECLPFRKKIIANGQGALRRVGHMPGASLLTLAVADADYEQTQADCADLAYALAKGRRIRLMTQDAYGNRYLLEADIGGWDQIPVASDGVIPLGAWGNIPGGESYIAPILGTAEGHIVINCALPGLPLYQSNGQRRLWQEEVLLSFQGGCFIGYQTPSDAITQVLEYERQYAEGQGDQAWRNLAEIGLGTNKSVHNATGISLVDEKMYGTVHIAIGDNISHGGRNKSVIHCDMVTFAQVEIDGKTVLANGQICFAPKEWMEHYSNIVPKDIKQTCTHVRWAGNEYKIERQKLYKVSSSGAGRLLKLQVGDPETARLAALVVELLPVDRRYIAAESLVSLAEMPSEMLMQILQLLYDYRLIDIHSEFRKLPSEPCLNRHQ